MKTVEMSSKQSISAYDDNELTKIKTYLIKEYPEDEDHISKFLINMPFPICVHVYKNKADGFGNRIEYDYLSHLDNAALNEVVPIEVYINPENYPEYFL